MGPLECKGARTMRSLGGKDDVIVRMATASANNAAHMPHMSTRLKRRSSDVRPCLRRSSDVRPSLPAMAGGALLDEAPQAYLPDANWDGNFHFYTILKVSIVSPVADITVRCLKRAFKNASSIAGRRVGTASLQGGNSLTRRQGSRRQEQIYDGDR